MSHRNTSLSMRRANSMAITAHNPSTSKINLPGGNGKGMSCSTPEPQCAAGSPCNSDSDAASPVPFLCTQDGSYGDTEVIWNYYTPRADRERQSRVVQHTPLSRKNRRTKPKNKIGQLNQSITRAAPQLKKRPKELEKKNQLYQDLLEMNKNIQGFLSKTQKDNKVESMHEISGSEDDIFNSSGDRSPKLDGFTRSGSRSLRRNLLNSKYSRTDPEPALESDDSMNECLIRASQMVEENVFLKRTAGDDVSVKKCKLEQDSMDTILNNITLDGSVVKKDRSLVNDSFDNFMGNLNDSALDRLTQLPIINESPKHDEINNKISNCKTKPSASPTFTHHGNSGWTIKELISMDSVPSPRSTFSRHNSMPVSPAPAASNRPTASSRPSASSTALSRHSSMPWHPAHRERPENSSEDSTPIRCTPEEIKRKRQQAREKLHAKRLFPAGNTQQSQVNTENVQTRSAPKFQPRFPTKQINAQPANTCTNKCEPKQQARKVETVTTVPNGVDLKSVIEKKRKEALLKLKMKRSQNNVP